MYFISREFNSMGYSMSRLNIDSELLCDGERTTPEAGGSHRAQKPLNSLDHEVAQATKLTSAPHEHLSQVLPGKRENNVSTVKMLAGREGNYSGRGRFSTADCCHVMSRYLPVNAPSVVDQMPTRAYVSQFSMDGSLFVAGFQGSNIRIYNVDKGWKVQKNILAKKFTMDDY